MTPGTLVPSRVSGTAHASRRRAFSATPRALRLWLVGVLLVLPMWLDVRLVGVMALWDLTILIAWVVDLRRLPPPASLTVARTWPGTLTLGVSQRISLEITNGSDTAVDARITDLASPLLRREPEECRVSVRARASQAICYDVMPVSRGDIEIGGVEIRYRSALGLAERWVRVPLRQTVRVHPSLAVADRERLTLVRARQMALERRRARQFGLGRDFRSLREFQDGDEPRDICWTATARRGRLVTRTYQPERSQTVWIVLDAGRLMRARDGIHTRLDRAVSAALAVARVASDGGDRVGLLAYGRAPLQRIAPGRGPAHLRRLLDALAVVRSSRAEADHARAATTIMTMQKRRALVIWLTDVAESAAVPDVIDGASRLVPAHVVVFAVARPDELVTLAAAVPSDSGSLFRVTAAQEMVERRARLLGDLRQHGALTIEVPAPHLAAATVDRYLTVKERNLL